MSTTALDTLLNPKAEVKTKPLLNDRKSEFSKEIYNYILMSQGTTNREEWFKDTINSFDHDHLYKRYVSKSLFNHREYSKKIGKLQKLVDRYCTMGKIVYDCKHITDPTMSLYLTVAMVLDTMEK